MLHPDPLVSIITPTYNHRQFIAACIESVLAQSYTNWEMLIIDDGSIDETVAVVSSFNDSRIRVLRQQHQGVYNLAATYNRALEAAQGEIIGILEGDDWWPPTKLETQVPDFCNDQVVLSSGLTQIVMEGRSNQVTPNFLPPPDIANNRPLGTAARLMMAPGTMTYTFPVATMLRTSTLRSMGGFQQPPYLPLTDFPTFLRFSIEGEWRFHNTVVGYWRRHAASVTSSRLSEILENAYQYTFEFIREFHDRLPLTDIELDELERTWDRANFGKCVLRGRMFASQGRLSEAKKAMKEAFFYRSRPASAVLAALARLLLAIGLPIEPLYKLAGSGSWETLVTLETGDRVVHERDLERSRFVGRWRELEKAIEAPKSGKEAARS